MDSLQFNSIKTLLDTLTSRELTTLNKIIKDTIEKKYTQSLPYRIWASIKKSFPNYDLDLHYIDKLRFIIKLTNESDYYKLEYSKHGLNQFYQWGGSDWKSDHPDNYLRIVNCCNTFESLDSIWNEDDALNYLSIN